MAHAKVESAGPAIAGIKKSAIELPRKWWQWMIAVLLTIVVVITLLFVSGMHTGYIGFVPVEGNSMQSVFPWGTAVFVIPTKPRDDDYVVGWGRLENPETSEDQEFTLMVKKLTGDRLVSLDNNDHSVEFEIRGVVVGQLPIQKVFWWLNKGGQNSASAYHPSTIEEHDRVVMAAEKTELENAVETGGVKYVLRPGFGLVAIDEDGKESQVELDSEITSELCPYNDGVLVGLSRLVENEHAVGWIVRDRLVKTKEMPAIVQSVNVAGDTISVQYQGGATELSF